MEARRSKDSIGLGLPIAHRWHRIIARDLDTVLIKAEHRSRVMAKLK
jgi:hypothetical protein